MGRPGRAAEDIGAQLPTPQRRQRKLRDRSGQRREVQDLHDRDDGDHRRRHGVRHRLLGEHTDPGGRHTRKRRNAADSAITVQTRLPSGTRAAAVQITVADSAGPGFLTAWSEHGQRPATSVLNYRRAGDVDGNFVIVPLAADATFKVYTTAHAGIIVDVMGFPYDYTAIPPQRVLDSRQHGGSAAFGRPSRDPSKSVGDGCCRPDHRRRRGWTGIPDRLGWSWFRARRVSAELRTGPTHRRQLHDRAVHNAAFSIFTVATPGSSST
jgi:hypothetical protein